MQTVLTIAGFDPSSGAGITADLATFSAHGLFGTSAITALTVQSTCGVLSIHPVSPTTLDDTIRCLTEDLPPAGVKIGMLVNAATVALVATFLTSLRRSHPKTPIVLDPIFSSTSGWELLDPTGIEALRTQLLSLVDWITPNLAELSILTTLPVTTHDQVPPAAVALRARYPHLNILATGGHLDPPDDLLLIVGQTNPIWLPGEHISSTSTHGTGCALASALLSRLVLGDNPQAAAQAAKDYVAQAIRTATPMGGGKGPLNLIWPLQTKP
jgi:hydroxymethylpyrimidine/phosphomethylpyrimidine kinase